MSWRGVAGKMADVPSNNKSLRKLGKENPGLNRLDSLYYDHAGENGGEV
jgi:hypothetical protein